MGQRPNDDVIPAVESCRANPQDIPRSKPEKGKVCWCMALVLVFGFS